MLALASTSRALPAGYGTNQVRVRQDLPPAVNKDPVVAQSLLPLAQIAVQMTYAQRLKLIETKFLLTKALGLLTALRPFPTRALPKARRTSTAAQLSQQVRPVEAIMYPTQHRLIFKDAIPDRLTALTLTSIQP